MTAGPDHRPIIARRRRRSWRRPRARSRTGGLVAFPTETVYGLGADATNAKAVALLYQAKGRPAFNPLISHVADLDAAEQIARFDAHRAGRWHTPSGRGR